MGGRKLTVGAIVIVALVLVVAARRGQAAPSLVLSTVAFTAPPSSNNAVTPVGMPAANIQAGPRDRARAAAPLKSGPEAR